MMTIHSDYSLLPIEMQELVNKWLILYDDLSLHNSDSITHCLNFYDERYS